MSTLYLIRHGQASYGAADYDVLSDLGAEQSRELGTHWGSRGRALDAVYSGPRKRQVDTATHFLEAATAAGTPYPEPTVLDDFDEYPAFELLKHWMPILLKEDPQFAELLSGGASARQMDRALDVIITRWATGELDTGELESFVEFVDRVDRGLRQVMSAQGRGKNVAVVTSGGPISVSMKLTLGIADERTLRLAWVIANASVTEFRYRDEELTMIGFNRIPHLDDERLITYR